MHNILDHFRRFYNYQSNNSYPNVLYMRVKRVSYKIQLFRIMLLTSLINFNIVTTCNK